MCHHGFALCFFADMLDTYGPLPESVIVKYVKQSLEGLVYLHKNHVIHRDLKCGNLLITTGPPFCALTCLERPASHAANACVRGPAFSLSPVLLFVLFRRRRGQAVRLWRVQKVPVRLACPACLLMPIAEHGCC